MPTFPFPPSSDDEQKEQPKQKPEFIYVGEESHQEQTYERETRDIFADLQKLNNIRFPITLRLLSLFMSLLCVLWSFGSFLCASPFAIAVLATGGQAKSPRKYLFHFFNNFKKAAALATGFFITFFSPLLGLSFIFLVYLYRGNVAEVGQFMNRWTK